MVGSPDGREHDEARDNHARGDACSCRRLRNHDERQHGQLVCKYKAISAAVYVTMYGPANRPAYCQSLAKGWDEAFSGVIPALARLWQ